MDREPIAIIGMGCRFPGAENKEAFWQLLRNGVDAITEVPRDRWDIKSFYDSNFKTPGKMNTRWGGFLKDLDKFDPQFFHISPREATTIDPQQRLLQEVAWEALEDAGQIPERLSGTKTGVFIGINSFDYYMLLMENPLNINAYAGAGNTNCIAANRISYFLNLNGPSLSVDTACSSSLVAVHLACQSIWNGESTIALAGGVRIILSPWVSVSLAKTGFMAPDGRCKAFDSRADGYVRSEGAGVIVLKPLSQAISERDPIYAVIRGSAVNQDGRSNGITAPNPWAQEAVLREAYSQAGVSPGRVQYIEAHGTGTKLGDPIEMKALGKVLAENRPTESYCAVGSVKTNIGHLETASGIAGLIKVALSLKHQQIPSSLHFEQPSPLIPFEKLSLRVQQTLQPWTETEDKAIAGVSSFSFGGTNAHVVLEEAPLGSKQPKAVENCCHLLTLSAKSENALKELAGRYANFLEAKPKVSLSNVCLTASTGRSHFAHRLGVVGQSREQLIKQLQAHNTDSSSRDKIKNQQRPTVAFLFTGQGSQYLNMGRQLYETQPKFRQVLEQCDALLQPYLERSLLSVLFPESADDSLLNQTAYTQPALFAIEYALARLWDFWGIRPDIVVGHSLGEYVAACIAGVFSLEDGLRLVALRAKLMQSLPPTGMMAAVFASEAQVMAAIVPYKEQVAIASINGNTHTVISGERTAVKAVLKQLQAKDFRTRILQVSHAFHSPLIEPILDQFEQVANQVEFTAPHLPLISNLTGHLISENEINGTYWRHHSRYPVQFAAGLKTLAEQGCNVFIELGSHPVLSNMGKRCLTTDNSLWLPSMHKGQDNLSVILKSLSALYAHGGEINWSNFYQNYHGFKIPLPTYPFQRKRYWIEFTESVETDNQLMTMNNSNTLNNSQTDSYSKISSTNGNFKVARKDKISSILLPMISRWLKIDKPAELDVQTTFLDMGADSITLLEAVSNLEKTFGVKIEMRKFFEELATIEALVDYLEQNLNPNWGLEEVSLPIKTDERSQTSSSDNTNQSVPPVVQQNLSHTPMVVAYNNAVDPAQKRLPLETPLTAIVRQQLEVMSQQMKLLGGTSISGVTPTLTESKPSASLPPSVEKTNLSNNYSQQTLSIKTKPARSTKTAHSNSLTNVQQKYLDAFIVRYNELTQGSKKQKQDYHHVLADKRAAAKFRPCIKELIYPIVGKRSQGAKIWDVDDNEYIDLSMGFGVHLFGHSPDFIVRALETQIKEGVQIGPQSSLSGEVAALISELTGQERVAFCNTGSEAVMTAIRLARCVTGRNKIALFAGSYHGQTDGTLFILSETEEGVPSALPLTGVSSSLSQDTLMLKYGDPKSLEILQNCAHELAAVLVEPVQSAHPDLQPTKFLQDLRQLTAANGTILIFDEVITGFRLHPEGAKAWYGVDADLTTYGKIVGGGMPIGILAGKAKYMNSIDGGFWNYGDRSRPKPGTIFYGGTFNKNPLTTATARAVLQHLKEQGTGLQESLNQKTAKFVEAINAYFRQENVPLEILYCGSLFRFTVVSETNDSKFVDRMSDSTLEIDLFYFHLIAKGIYIWEGARLFLSTAHTDDDLERVIQAVKETVTEMRTGGFFLLAPESSPNNQSQPDSGAIQIQTDDSVFKLNPDPDKRYVPFPLTDIQQAYWIGESSIFELGNVKAHTYDEYEIVDLDLDRCNRALQKLVARHDMLRAIVLADGQQQILERVPEYRIPVIDLQNQDSQEVTANLTATRERMSHQGPTTNQWPLFEILVHRLDEKRCQVHLSISLMILDGQSDSIITQEFCQLYENLKTSLPPLELSFRDYVLALNSSQQSKSAQTSLKYWRDRLATLPAAPELPLAKNLASVSETKFIRRQGRLEPEIWQQFKTRAAKVGLTPTNALLTAYCEVIATWSKSRHFTINILFFNRLPLHHQINEIFGNLSSTILLEVNNTEQLPLKNRAKQIQSQLLTDLEHSDVSGIQVLRELNRTETHTSGVAMPIVFASNFNLNTEEEVSLADYLPSKLIYSSLQTPQVLLDHQVYEQDGALIFDWDAVEEAFSEELLDEMFCAYCRLLNLLVEETTWNKVAINLLPPAQLQRQVSLNATQASLPKGMLHTLVAEQVEKRSQQPAIIANQKTLTYEELDRYSNRVAHWLRQSNVRPNSLVAVVMEKGWEQIVAVLGILRSGAAYLPIDPSLPKERVDYLLARGEVKLILTQSWIEQKLDWPQHLSRFSIDSEDLAKLSDEPLELIQQPEDLAYVIFTSGSTGSPKGVAVSHCSAVNTICDINQRFDIGSEDRILALSSLSFDLSVYDIFGTLSAGGTIILPDASALKDPVHWAELLIRERVTVWNSVPALMQMLVEYVTNKPEKSADSLRLTLLSGDWIPVTLPNRIKALFANANVVCLGGATEASIWSIIYPIEEEIDPTRSSIPYGKPMLNQRIYVLNEILEPCPTWVIGQLYIAGAGLAREYWKDEAKTNACFIKHPKTGERLYRTGDLGRYLPDGNIEFLGREDFQVKVQGYRIELGEIETVLTQHPAVREAVAVAVAERADSQRLVAYLISQSDLVVDSSEIRQFLAAKLPEYMIPSTFVILDELPLTSNGKVDRKALPAPEKTASNRQIAFVAPRNSLELKLCQILAELLENDTVGIADNFFELGGNSLLAVRLTAKIQQQLGQELSLSTLLQNPTVEHLARLLQQENTTRPKSPLVAIQPAGSQLRFFCIHPVGGNVLCYINLARHLGKEQPFYALESVGLDGIEQPYLQIEDMAAHYLQAILTLQPEGPYLLGGWSMGGIVAFEMAHQLQQQDREVASLIMLDSWAPTGKHNCDEAQLLSWFVRNLGGQSAYQLNLSPDELRQLESEERWIYVVEQVRKANILPSDISLTQIKRLLQVFQANTQAMWNYVPQVYRERIVLLRPNEVFSEDFQDSGDPTLGWSQFTTEPVEIHPVSGNHYTMLAEPHVQSIVEQLKPYFNQ